MCIRFDRPDSVLYSNKNYNDNLDDYTRKMQPFLLPLSEAVDQTLAYADVFDYPLTAFEIHRYLVGCPASLAAVEQYLAENPALYPQLDGYYTLPGQSRLVELRKQRAKTSQALRVHARRYARMMENLPFIRMVALTGSLAMENVSHGADIDYLIVTERGRLWLARAMVILLGYFARLQSLTICPNYLITTAGLYFQDQTLYTAHELAQMAPLAGMETYLEIRRQNTWVETFLPNAGGPPAGGVGCQSLATPVLKRMGEAILSMPPGGWLEAWEMKRKIERLSRQPTDSQEIFYSAEVCKGHDQQHQARTQSAWHTRLQRLKKI